MPDRLTALAGHLRPGRFGDAAVEPAGITVAERRGLGLVQVAAFPEDEAAVAEALESALGLALPHEPGRSTRKEALSLLWTGPQRWLIVAGDGRDGLEQAVADALAGREAVAVTDLSHARTVLRIGGPRWRDLLAKGCPLDLHPGAFPVGACASSQFGHIAVTLHRAEEASLDLYALRSFGLALWEELSDLAGEFGYSVTD